MNMTGNIWQIAILNGSSIYVVTVNNSKWVMMQLLMAGGIRLEDPHHILDAMKRKDIEIYDYLESLQIKRRY